MRIVAESPETMVSEYLAAKMALDKAKARLDELAERVIKQMEADQRKSFRWKSNGRAYSVTYTRARTTTIDEPGLRKELGAKTFDKYTKRVLDRKAMEAAMDTGEIDPVIVSKHVQVVPGHPYLRTTDKPLESTPEDAA